MNQEPKYDPLAAIYHQQAAPKMPEPAGLVKRLMAGIAGRFITGIFVSTVIGVVTHSGQITKVVGFVAAGIARVMGYEIKPPEEEKKRFDDIFRKGKDVIDQTVNKGEGAEEGEEDAPKKGKLREMVGKVAAPVKKAAHETAEKIDDAKEQAKESVEGVKDTVKSVGDKLEGKLGGGGGRRPTDAQARRAMGEALGEGDGDSLTGDAQRAVGRIGARGRSFTQGAGKALEDARKKAEEMAQQQAGAPPARCPYCKAGMHIPARSSGSYMCKGCGSSVMAGEARAAAKGGRR